MSDAKTNAFYNTEAPAYAARARAAPHLADFLAELSPGAAVLDLGCGGGQDSAALRDAGFQVISIDASAGLAAEAKRLWAVDVRVLNFVTFDYDSCFEGIWAWASLHHARGDELPIIFARLRRALKPNGVLHASLKAGAKDRRDKFERFFCAMDEARLRTLAAGWGDVRIDRNQGAGYDDEPTPWLRLKARA